MDTQTQQRRAELDKHLHAIKAGIIRFATSNSVYGKFGKGSKEPRFAPTGVAREQFLEQVGRMDRDRRND